MQSQMSVTNNQVVRLVNFVVPGKDWFDGDGQNLAGECLLVFNGANLLKTIEYQNTLKPNED